MKQYKDERLHREGRLICIFKRLAAGIKAIKGKPIKVIPGIFIFTIGVYIIVNTANNIGPYADDFDIILNQIATFLYLLIMMFLLLIYLVLIGMPMDAKMVSWNLQRIGFKNSIGEVPKLISKEKRDGFVILEFFCQGIPLSIWEEKRNEIESVLNIKIVRIKSGRTLDQIFVQAVDYNSNVYMTMLWDDRKLSKVDFELVLGESLIGQEKVNLNSIPHILIGGSTGSGKSILLKNLLYQAKAKGAEVIISDFKGGVDFGLAWRKEFEIITNMDILAERLEEIIVELERRKKLLFNAGAENIYTYNKSHHKLNHIIFACDEVAEILDKTGASKEYKEKIMQVESKLSTIARQGRAFGINLILATQRPDANILSGQIRNNIDCRICGRADDVLSKIILDNTDASELIPKDEQGLFLRNNGTVFKGYYFDR